MTSAWNIEGGYGITCENMPSDSVGNAKKLCIHIGKGTNLCCPPPTDNKCLVHLPKKVQLSMKCGSSFSKKIIRNISQRLCKN